MKFSAGFAVAMVAELIIALEAEQDLTESYDWYQARRVGLRD